MVPLRAKAITALTLMAIGGPGACAIIQKLDASSWMSLQERQMIWVDLTVLVGFTDYLRVAVFLRTTA